jgi:hypothetical protein
MKRIIIISLAIITGACSSGTMNIKGRPIEEKKSITSNSEGKGHEIVVDLSKGPSFYYPLFAVWLEDSDGNYIQTLYVAESVATGVFKYGKQENNKWVTAARRAPQTLPYWAHKRGIKASDGLYIPDSQTVVPDAYTGATPVTGFVLTSRADSELPENYRVLLEINQNWDWNEYWTNDKYPDDQNYKMSCQPALVYSAEVNSGLLKDYYKMKPIGHSHYSGKTGELFTDLSTFTTALQIADSIVVRIR